MNRIPFFKSRLALWVCIAAFAYLVANGLEMVDQWENITLGTIDPDKQFRAYVALISRTAIDSIFLFGTAVMVEYLFRIGLLLQRIKNGESGKSLFEDETNSEKQSNT